MAPIATHSLFHRPGVAARSLTMTRFLLLPMLVILAGPLLAPWSPAHGDEQAATLTVPHYWDPQRRIERPNLAGFTGTVRFLTAPDHPPFNFLNAQNELTGFNVELVQAACLELSLRCTIQARGFDTLLPAIRDKQADAAIAGLALTPALRRDMDVGDVYLHNPARFVVRRASEAFATDGEGLRGKNIGVVTGSAHAAFLSFYYKASNLKPYPTAQLARDALKKGEVEAVFGDAVSLSFWINGTASDNCCTFRGGAFDESRFFGEGYAIVFRNGASALRQAFDHALLRLAERGVYSEIYLRWFPISLY